jgi:hypothetical protein
VTGVGVAIAGVGSDARGAEGDAVGVVVGSGAGA